MFMFIHIPTVIQTVQSLFIRLPKFHSLISGNLIFRCVSFFHIISTKLSLISWFESFRFVCFLGYNNIRIFTSLLALISYFKNMQQNKICVTVIPTSPTEVKYSQLAISVLTEMH